MKRFIDSRLTQWAQSVHRKPLLLRGARQVGKTFAARKLGQFFDNFVEINFDLHPALRNIFEPDLEPTRIIRELSVETVQPIIPGRTLLLLDEIQEAPNAIKALRYFYEKMPELHVIAAGSLIDFAIEKIGIPVGRVSSLYMYPMSFVEFLNAAGHHFLIDVLQQLSANVPLPKITHDKCNSLVGEYLAIGGMPEAVQIWVERHDANACFQVHHELLDSYRQDFDKYATKFQEKYVSLLFEKTPFQLGRKFKYSNIPGEYRKRELAPCLDLLSTAGIIHRVTHSAGQGVPLGAQVDFDKFKVIFLDVALAQTLLGVDLRDWILNTAQQFVNKGEIVEAFVGQEILAYSSPIHKSSLYYWQREAKNSAAEIDYLIQQKNNIIPIEVKSGVRGTLRSLATFLSEHPHSPYGLRFSSHPYSIEDKLHSYPLYAIIAALGAEELQLK